MSMSWMTSADSGLSGGVRMTDEGPGEPEVTRRRSDAELVDAVAAAMDEVFGVRSIEIAERQIALTDTDRPSVAARWHDIRSALEKRRTAGA